MSNQKSPPAAPDSRFAFLPDPRRFRPVSYYAATINSNSPGGRAISTTIPLREIGNDHIFLVQPELPTGRARQPFRLSPRRFPLSSYYAVTTNSSNVETARTTFQLKSQGPRCRQAGKRAGARPPVRAIRLQPERPSRDIWATSGRSMAPVASAGARDDEHQGSNNDCSEAVVNEATEATTTATVEGGSTGSHPSGVAGLIVTLSSTIDDNLRLFR